MSHVSVIVEDFANHPQCPHGPTILFSRYLNGEINKFFACSAYRDRKDCAFYLEENERDKVSVAKKDRWREEAQSYVKAINHRKEFITYHKVLVQSNAQRRFCHTCNEFLFTSDTNHQHHRISSGIDDYLLQHPSMFLTPLDNPKKEAQFLFSKVAVETIVDIIQDLKFGNVVCLGAPRIHEYILAERPTMTSILLDFDKRYHSFFGPLQFCWYNMFNDYFFLSNAKEVLRDFLKTNSGEGLILVMDPPFGGRVELLAQSISSINKLYADANNIDKSLPILWTFPYFMEPQILNSLPDFAMLDYKVDYENHSLFQDGTKGRKFGSPVRLFTNLDPCTIKLPPDQGYKHCNLCSRWVSNENKHCSKCNTCTSKDGRTYIHCNLCQRCVKPTWKHCSACKRCAQPNHSCQDIPFIQACFHCKETGHKKRQCPLVNHKEIHLKRKKGTQFKSKKFKQM